jgi:glycosyltransferase involved in cell wall biosynthesis
VTPILSVCVSVYRQEAFVAQCVESILAQETDFEFEVLVSDDCSPDGTRAVLLALDAKYPGRLRLMLSECNRGPFGNYIALHSEARGKYVAHVDGDDYLLPGKLQRQVDFLEANPDCNVSWHRMLLVADGRTMEHPAMDLEFVGRRLYRDEVCALGAFGPHSSTMYRRERFDLAKFREKCDDWFYALVYMGEGYAWMLPEVLAAYRILPTSMSSGARPTRNNRLLSTSSQLQALALYPDTGKYMAVRAWANFALDAMNLRSYAWLHLRVALACRRLPVVALFARLYRFYLWSRFPPAFR